MAALTRSKHEAFAQARSGGLGILESYHKAGYTGGKGSAKTLQRRPDVKARIAELQESMTTRLAYDREAFIRDLIHIIETPPSAVGESHRLSEVSHGRSGPEYTLPSKMAAMDRLAKIMGWYDVLPGAAGGKGSGKPGGRGAGAQGSGAGDGDAGSFGNLLEFVKQRS